MASITKGATPTITYTFSVVDVGDLTEAILTIKHRRGIVEKVLEEASVDNNEISWRLSQEETLALYQPVSMMLNFKTADGTRGASKKTNILLESNYVNEVI